MPLRVSSSLVRPYVCSSCTIRQVRRTFSTTPALLRNPPPPPSSGYAPLPKRSLLSITGPDTTKFLNGLLTSSVPAPSTSGTGGFYSAFLTAQGRVLFDVFLYASPTSGQASSGGESSVAQLGEDEGFLVEVDAEQKEALLKHLKRHKLRSKIRLRAVESDELGVVAAWREEGRWSAYSFGHAGRGSGLGLLDQRAPGMGTRLLVRGSSRLGDVEELEGLEEVDAEQYRIRRYLKGVPEGQGEIIRDASLPMGCNLDVMGAIDFRKGCYVGQELTIRTHHTGVVRRRILPVQLFDGEAPERQTYNGDWKHERPKTDDDIVIEGRRGKPGKWVAGVGNIGLAMCRLEMMSDVPVTNEPSTYSADDRFAISVGDGESQSKLGVKAFVPDWLRGKIRAPKTQKRVE